MEKQAKNKSGHESHASIFPLFHLVKRDTPPTVVSVGIRATAVLWAFTLAGILTWMFVGVNPFDLYEALFRGSFHTIDNFLVMLRQLAYLLCVSLAVTPAFKMRFWNTGAEGQVLMGVMGAAFCMYNFKSLPLIPLVFLMFLFAMVCGAVWGAIPAIFKAIWGTNETLFTLMMNYVAAEIIILFMRQWNRTSASVDFKYLDPSGKLRWFFGVGTAWEYIFPLLIVLLITVIVYVYQKYSKHGYEISVVGESENTARYVGINVKKVIIRTMIVSGMICGIAGFLLIGPSRSLSGDMAGGRGFTAIMVSWLAKFNPITMIATSFLLVFLDCGAKEIVTMEDISPAFTDIIAGIMLFCIIGSEFFIRYNLEPGQGLKRLFAFGKKKASADGEEPLAEIEGEISEQAVSEKNDGEEETRA